MDSLNLNNLVHHMLRTLYARTHALHILINYIHGTAILLMVIPGTSRFTRARQCVGGPATMPLAYAWITSTGDAQFNRSVGEETLRLHGISTAIGRTFTDLDAFIIL